MTSINSEDKGHTAKEPRYNEIRSRKFIPIADLKTTSENKKAIKKFIEEYLPKVRKLNPSTIQRYYYCLTKLVEYFDPELDFKEASKDTIISVLGAIGESDLAEETKRKISIGTKVFYKFLLDDDEPRSYPKQVSWIKTSVAYESKLKAPDLLPLESLIKIIERGRSIRDKAILAILVEWGLRVSELTTMRINSVRLDEGQITVTGKTGTRTLFLTMAKPYLTIHMENMKHAAPEDYLWQAEGTWKNKKAPITNAAVNKMLKIAAKDAGIKRDVWVHYLRHCSASRNAPYYSTDIMNYLYGWSKSSGMHSIYISLTGAQAKEAVMRRYGLDEKQKEEQIQKECKSCGKSNPITYSFCYSCGYDLSKPKSSYQESKDAIKGLIVEQLKDPKLLEDVIHAYLLEDKKRKQNNIK